MIKIDMNGIREEMVSGFYIRCERGGSPDVKITIGGAEEHGEVGAVEMICRECKNWQFSEMVKGKRV